MSEQSKPARPLSPHEIPGLWMLYKDGSWRICYEPTNPDAMLAYGTTGSDCPADVSSWVAYDGATMVHGVNAD